MKIYVCHSSSFDFSKELYEPLKTIQGHEFVFPHDRGNDAHSEDVIASCDLVIAEVSFPSTGMGIELGWADAAGVPIACVHRADTMLSSALRHIAKSIVAYGDAEDLVGKLGEMLKNGG
jgi:hypothetical protein